jgi:valyl-tRNA synthetase
MMMLGIHFRGDAPFRTTYLHGLVRDPYGQKMSKTKGNVEDPLQLIDEIGADALRFALLVGVSPGNDMRISRPKLEGARNFANKVWNATRFVVGARPEFVDGALPLELPAPGHVGPAESWILARVARDVEAASRAMEELRFGEAARVAYDGLWGAFADWYVEIAKVRLADDRASAEERGATWNVLVWALDAYLRVLHPFMPFLTEEAWSHLPHRIADGPFLMTSAWPTATEVGAARAAAEPGEAAAVERLIDLIGGIRNARHEAGIAPGDWLTATITSRDEAFVAVAQALAPAVERLARLRPLEIGGNAESHAAAGDGILAVLSGDVEARIQGSATAGATERARLERELAEARGGLARADERLANRAFTERAPTEVVSAARARADELRQRVATLEDTIR